eukprot:2513610-Rhodomonas_salina.1
MSVFSVSAASPADTLRYTDCSVPRTAPPVARRGLGTPSATTRQSLTTSVNCSTHPRQPRAAHRRRRGGGEGGPPCTPSGPRAARSSTRAPASPRQASAWQHTGREGGRAGARTEGEEGEVDLKHGVAGGGRKGKGQEEKIETEREREEGEEGAQDLDHGVAAAADLELPPAHQQLALSRARSGGRRGGTRRPLISLKRSAVSSGRPCAPRSRPRQKEAHAGKERGVRRGRDEVFAGEGGPCDPDLASDADRDLVQVLVEDERVDEGQQLAHRAEAALEVQRRVVRQVWPPPRPLSPAQQRDSGPRGAVETEGVLPDAEASWHSEIE